MPKTHLPGKTCVACGLKKPLTAFLEITGPQGTNYGNVCSTCRGSGVGRKITVPQDDEDIGSSSTGLKIDHKTKLHHDLEKLKLAQKIKDAQHEEQNQEITEKDEKAERKESKERAEKKHRAEYLDPQKKEAFLNYQSKKAGDTQTPRTLQNIEATIKKISTDEQAVKEGLISKEDKTVKEEVVQLEKKLADEDYSGVMPVKHIVNVMRNNPFYEKWKRLVGPIAATETFKRQVLNTQGKSQTDKILHSSKENTQTDIRKTDVEKKTLQTKRQFLDNKNKIETKPTVKDAIDFIHENFESNSAKKTPPGRRG